MIWMLFSLLRQQPTSELITLELEWRVCLKWRKWLARSCLLSQAQMLWLLLCKSWRPSSFFRRTTIFFVELSTKETTKLSEWTATADPTTSPTPTAKSAKTTARPSFSASSKISRPSPSLTSLTSSSLTSPTPLSAPTCSPSSSTPRFSTTLTSWW